MITVNLDWPPRVLHPNSRSHWALKSKAAKKYRTAAYYSVFGNIEQSEKYQVDIIFYPPNNRRRDLDGCLSSIKSGLDGIADRLGVDDSKFCLSIDLSDTVVKNGVVTITIKNKI